MNTEVERARDNREPRVFVNSIKFNDGTVLQLNHNSIIVFIGPNNCGKSQVLRDIESRIEDSKRPSIVVSELTLDYVGLLDEDFVRTRFERDESGRYQGQVQYCV
ncbi:MAG TPA: hypothetical protein GX729_01200 [Firmicutes bacterium]|jgi:ABC-type phosphate transport system ATPase subunit|nr:hypothetical protein [Bacillota bacterium]